MKLNEIKLWKLNILDLAIIFIVIIFGVIFASSKLSMTNSDVVAAGSNSVSTKFCYTISVEGLSETSRAMIKVGDEVYDKVSGTYIGKIIELNISESKGELEKVNGEVILASIPGKIDVSMKIETEGMIKNEEYLANGLIRIMVGNLKEIKTKYLMCFGTITSIDKK